jgi:hypothetical protein
LARKHDIYLKYFWPTTKVELTDNLLKTRESGNPGGIMLPASLVTQVSKLPKVKAGFENSGQLYSGGTFIKPHRVA